ncbi:MAG: aminoglycoside phosphotransferase family protein [Microbacteriaceae bacterium]|nr:aminoglycoside phosphotransferase family protein [Microbacteriaceae bacterium]MCL2794674.1 aminoglycoside phosphotransferase family protein [Microbacteriaceae bacterium]
MDTLALDDGRLVELGDRTPGGSKNETRFGRLGEQPVVVKIQRSHGRVQEERQALEYLISAGVRVPRVVGSGMTSSGEPILVISREGGSFARTPAGWRRFGRDLAALESVDVSDSPFRCVPMREFVDDHRERLAIVRALLDAELADAIADALRRVEGEERLALTHGDPGTGNYLDTGDDAHPGVLLDWETASVSPFGLDLGRAAFIGLLDLGRSGTPEDLAAAVIHGYRERSVPAAGMSTDLLNSWVAVAGLQFIHGRHLHPLVTERTPQVAASVLRARLSATG